MTIFAAAADGTGEHQLTAPGEYSGLVRVSPDGTRILTMPGQDPSAPPVTGGTIAVGAERLQPTGGPWTVGPDGSGLTKIFEDADGRYPVQPTWSPNGSQIMLVLDPVADKFTHPDNGST